MARNRPRWVTVGMSLLLAPAALGFDPLGSGFKYQGYLEVPDGTGFVPADGLYDFRFELFNVAVGGTGLTAPLFGADIDVDRGVFTVPLDFGASLFADEALWIEIAVRDGASTGAYGVIGRQSIAATPFSITSLKDAYWTLTGNNLTNSAGTRLGLNEGDPLARLHVTGTIDLGSGFIQSQIMNEDIVIEGREAWLGLFSANDSTVASGLMFGAFDDQTNTSKRWALFQHPDSAGGHLMLAEGSDSNPLNLDGVMRFETNGHVSIGMDSAPTAKLEIRGSGVVDTNASAPMARVRTRRPTGPSFPEAIIDLTETSINASIDTSGSFSDTFLELNDRSSGNVLIATGGGRVGAGESSPDAKLHVSAAVGESGAVIDTDYNTGISTGTHRLTLGNRRILAETNGSASDLVLNDAGGDVAIGHADAISRLHVTGTNLFGTTTADVTHNDEIFIEDADAWITLCSDASGNFGSGISLTELNGGTTTKWGIYRATGSHGDPNALMFSYGSNGATTSNDVKLEVLTDGTTRVKVLEITGADLAEKFPTTESAVPGTVMAIDAENAGKLCVARGAYNRRVAGVVSGANDFAVGAVLGNLPGNENAPPIALSGRVYVLCDAASGAIEPGDLLTTSATAGHAMKAVDREQSHGAVIGKAMTSLASGQRGLVLTLVNLQ
ncbi:MAG: hypothetical protein SF069_18805 [Phycisphaerae bacterium]|nr:hypothetical protein [Phycisphaerae bacterium]